MPGQPLPAGGIYNSNRFVLNALLRRLGCEVLDLGIVPDSREATRQALREAAEGADLIISAGGVSVGEEDHVRPAVEAEGQIDLWRVAIKPGRPLAYGRVGRHGPEGARAAVPGSFAHFIAHIVGYLFIQVTLSITQLIGNSVGPPLRKQRFTIKRK